MDKQNLIPFPVDRVKRREPAREVDLRSLVHDPKRSGALLSIVSVILLALALNPGLQRVYDRGLASVPTADVYDEATQARLESMFRSTNRLPASVGRQPTAEDRLRVEDLQGRYRLVYRDEYIAEISLIAGIDDPVLLEDPKSFLERYGSIIHPGFDTAEPEMAQDDGTRATYQLKKNGQAVGRAHLKLDRHGYFYSMNVE